MTENAANKIEEKMQKKFVVGLGLTGLSCVRYLKKQGYDVIAFDTRKTAPGLQVVKRDYPDVEVYLGDITEDILDDVDQIISSPGISLHCPLLTAAKQRNIEIVGDVEIFSSLAKAPIIAITGSNGKSTTTTLLADMIKADGKRVEIGGNIGVPVLDLLTEGAEIPDYYVLELSSFQLDTTSQLKAKAAVVLNISEDHMDRYTSLDEYGKSKLVIYENAENRVINSEDQWLRTNVDSSNNYTCFTTQEPQVGEYGLRVIDNEEWIVFGDEKILKTKKLKIKGRHQVANALAAIALGDLCRISREGMCKALKKFKGLKHRTQFVEKIKGVSYINDSKGTNVGATVAAVNGLDAPVVLIAGGVGKGADFSELKSVVKDKVSYVILIGKDARLIEKAIEGVVPVVHAQSMEEAVWLSADVAKKGDYVLLSPACASFDMYGNYEQRGEAFMQAVELVASELKNNDG